MMQKETNSQRHDFKSGNDLQLSEAGVKTELVKASKLTSKNMVKGFCVVVWMLHLDAASATCSHGLFFHCYSVSYLGLI